MPRGARVLAVQSQMTGSSDYNTTRENPIIWALVDPDAETVGRGFLLAGTGHPIDDNDAASGEYIGTFQLQGGGFVGHLFDMGEAQ